MILIVIFFNMPNWFLSTLTFIKNTDLINEFDSDDAFVCTMSLIMNLSVLIFSGVKIS